MWALESGAVCEDTQTTAAKMRPHKDEPEQMKTFAADADPTREDIENAIVASLMKKCKKIEAPEETRPWR